MPVTSALGRLRQENHEFEVSLGSQKDPVSKKKERKGIRRRREEEEEEKKEEEEEEEEEKEEKEKEKKKKFSTEAIEKHRSSIIGHKELFPTFFSLSKELQDFTYLARN
jgi:predicted Holliday junction resolvase-like endonuclease